MREVSRLVVLDTYVIFFNVLHRAIEAYGSVPEGMVAYAEAAFEWVDQLAWFPGLQSRGATVVWAEDMKPYWRSFYHPAYKEGRSPKPPIFEEIRQRFVEGGFRRVGIPGYEADDVAAAIVQLWRQRSLNFDQIYLVTCDSDWQGLVCQPDIFWIDTGGHAPRVRQRSEIYNWLLSKWNKQSRYTRELWRIPSPQTFESRHIWDWKRATGDTSDNLPPRSPLYLIDLLNPHPAHHLWNNSHFVTILVQELDKECENRVSLGQAERQMSVLGLNPPIPAISPAEFDPILFRPVL